MMFSVRQQRGCGETVRNDRDRATDDPGSGSDDPGPVVRADPEANLLLGDPDVPAAWGRCRYGLVVSAAPVTHC